MAAKRQPAAENSQLIARRRPPPGDFPRLVEFRSQDISGHLCRSDAGTHDSSSASLSEIHFSRNDRVAHHLGCIALDMPLRKGEVTIVKGGLQEPLPRWRLFPKGSLNCPLPSHCASDRVSKVTFVLAIMNGLMEVVRRWFRHASADQEPIWNRKPYLISWCVTHETKAVQ